MMTVTDLKNLLERVQTWPEDHEIFQEEATLNRTLECVGQLNAERVVLTHIEETDQVSYDELRTFSTKLSAEGRAIEFAYDGLRISF